MEFEKRVRIIIGCLNNGNGPSSNEEHTRLAAVKLVLMKMWQLVPQAIKFLEQTNPKSLHTSQQMVSLVQLH